MKRLLVLAALLLSAAPAFSQTLTFTLESTSSGGAAVVPRATWTTSPAGASCIASNGWTGAKAASGTELLPAISATKSYSLACTWPGIQTALVTWTAPTTNTDGSALTDLQGYRVQWGTSAADLAQSKYTENLLTTWTSPTLGAGTWFFGVRAYNKLGLESDVSNVVSKVMTASASQTRTLEIAIKFPKAPAGVTVE